MLKQGFLLLLLMIAVIGIAYLVKVPFPEYRLLGQAAICSLLAAAMVYQWNKLQMELKNHKED